MSFRWGISTPSARLEEAEEVSQSSTLFKLTVYPYVLKSCHIIFIMIPQCNICDILQLDISIQWVQLFEAI